ncbi:YybH family protein [Ferruginibacter yonginensis]|uniref:YybH family protein n=1 Tax=Ferruginibacter yonginensis TaxID=1310416 RepID=A0ABV8QP12_9BACT
MLHRIIFGSLCCVALAVPSCLLPNKKPAENDAVQAKLALMDVDEAFAETCTAKGLKDAYLNFIDSNGVMLRTDALPLAGADAVDYIIGLQDTGFVMSWKPTEAHIAESGELGYTYGIYKIVPSVADTVLYGNYVTIWKKQNDGKWKFILQSNNEGIGSDEP